MSRGLWLLFLFALMGAGTWLLEHQVQRGGRFRSLIVRPPRVIAWLCGNPRRDGTIDLDSGLRQLSALAFLVGAPPIFLLPLGLSQRAGLVFLVYALMSIPAFAFGGWVRWRSSQRLARKLDAGRNPRLIGS